MAKLYREFVLKEQPVPELVQIRARSDNASPHENARKAVRAEETQEGRFSAGCFLRLRFAVRSASFLIFPRVSGRPIGRSAEPGLERDPASTEKIHQHVRDHHRNPHL